MEKVAVRSLRKVRGRTLTHLCTLGLLSWLNNWGADGWISEEGCWEHFRREPRSSISGDDHILFQHKIDEGVGFETHVKVFLALNFTLCFEPLCHNSMLMKDLLGLNLNAESNLKFQVFCFFFSIYVPGKRLFFQQMIIWKCIALWLPLPLIYLRNFHVRNQTYY